MSKLNFCIGRIFSVTDTTQKPPYLIPSLEKKIKKSKNTLILKDLNHFRDFITTSASLVSEIYFDSFFISLIEIPCKILVLSIIELL